MLVLEVARKSVDKLETYRAKRKAGRTPEPFSSSLPASYRFVVQHHAARARHYDFRLEWQGVLKSWAVPKGPSPNPADKRLAVAVEDHPLEYASFEGLIPEGNYGAGAVILWDRGSWVALNEPEEGLAGGKLLFELKGYKLRGKWTLVKTRRGAKDWLLIKERDQYVSEAGTEGYPPDSILSGRTVDQVAARADLSTPLIAKLAKLGVKRDGPDPRRLRPMLAVAAEPFTAPGWVYEIKYDGYRLLASKEGDAVTLNSRAGHDLTQTFPEVAQVVAALPFDRLIIDGEVVVHDEHGLPSFARLQKRGRLVRRIEIERAEVEYPASFYAFDLIAAEGYDLRPLPLLERKALLQSVLPSTGPLRYSEHISEHGEAMFEHVQQLGLEGVVAKRADSRYVCRRSSDWLKINTQKVDDFAVLGYTQSKTAPGPFAALLVGQYKDGELAFAGRVGSGFDQRSTKTLARLFAAAADSAAPANAPRLPGAHWVESDLVAAVKFKERTADGLLRHPVFLHLREDKTPRECLWPDVDPPPDDPPAAAAQEAPARHVEFTNLDKVFWPDQRYTKGDLINYYRDIAPWLLPYLKGRPVVLTRYPDGIEGKSFFQKDAPVYAPDWMRIETMWSEQAQREIRYFVIDDEDSLLYVANMASIPLHVWSSRVGSLERPDWSILDLDPKGAPFRNVVKIARFLHRLCEEIGLEHFVKTSGSTGLHILIPLAARYTYEQSRSLAELLARVATRALDDIATITRALERREGKVYIDYLQNGHGRLLAAPFSARARPAASVSMPLTWTRINTRLKVDRYTIKSAPKIMARDGDPMAGVLSTSADLLGALRQLESHL